MLNNMSCSTNANLFCSTRGLDASSALDYIKALRAMTDVMGLATIVTLYQAGNGNLILSLLITSSNISRDL